MTTLPKSDPVPAISERILEPLRQVAIRQNLLRLTRGVLQVVVVTLAVWLVIVLTLGLLSGLPALLRIVLALLAWGTLLGASLYFLRPALRRQNLSSAAREIEQALPEVQERISSAVELAQEADPRFRGSPELVAHLTRQAERDAQSVDPFTVVRPQSVTRWALFCLPPIVLWLVALALLTPAVMDGFHRLFVPWDARSVSTESLFSVVPGGAEVPQGDSLRIIAEVHHGTDGPNQQATLVRHFANGQTSATEMERVGPRTYRLNLTDIQQGFAYHVESGEASSHAYQVAVLQRPAILGLDITCKYPAYTRLQPNPETKASRDGAIDAVVGTEVTLIVHANRDLLATEKTRLLFAEKTPDQLSLPLVRVRGADQPDYSATLTLQKSGQYRLQLASLVNGRELANRDDQLRTLIARPDTPPTIAITSPEPRLRIRPDDAVGVKFEAQDDFGIAGIEAIVQIDGRPPETLTLPLAGSDARKAGGTWMLSVAEQLARQNVPQAHRIRYQLKVTDTFQPQPHTAFSGEQYLEIARDAESVAARQDAAAARTMAEAVQKGRQKLEEARAHVEPLQNTADRAPSPEDRRQSAEARKDLAEAIRELNRAAESRKESSFEQTGEALKQVAQEHVTKASDDVGKAELTPDQPEVRRKNLQEAHQEIAEANQELNKISRSLDEQVKDRRMAERLDDMARRQRELADRMGQSEARNRQGLQNEQRNLQRQTEQFIKEHPEITNPQSQEPRQGAQDQQASAPQNADPRAAELARKVQQLAEAQKPLNERVITPTQAAAGKLDELARRQEALNKEIGQFGQAQREPLARAGGKPPEKQDLEPIPQQVRAQKLTEATGQQKKAAEALDKAAEKLEESTGQARQSTEKAQAAAQQAKQLAEAAQGVQERTQKAAEQIDQARKNNQGSPQPNNAAAEQARQAAREVQKAAETVSNKDISQRPAAEQAKAAAQQAEKAAQEGRMDEAQKKLQEAAGKLAESTRNAARQAENAAQAAKPPGAEAARQARQLADRQEELVKQTAQAAQDMQQAQAARQQQPMTAQDRQAAGAQAERLAEQMNQAAEQAERLGQEAQQQKNQPLAGQAAKAGQALREAAGKQREAGSELQGNDSQAAGEKQQQSRDKLAQAQQALGQGEKQATGDRASPDDQQAQKGQPAGASQGEPKPGQPEHGQSAQAKPADQQGQPEQGGQSAQAGQAGRQGQKPAPGEQAQTGQTAKAAAPQQRAAEALQDAREAQGQAAQEGQPGPAQQAAESLAEASRALSDMAGQAAPGQSQTPSGQDPQTDSKAQAQGKPASGQQGQGQAQPSGQGQQAQGQPQGQNPNARGQTANPQGVAISSEKSDDTRPNSVKQIGLSPSDWARLPPSAQQELLNAAQQHGPPAYQEMIKNYYVRIARMQDEIPAEKR